jgi:ribosomal protein S18 acetylase RimI-like enzyme
MELRNLAGTSIATLTKVFNTAFAVYYVPIHFTEEGMHFRIRRGRIDLSLSVGAYEQGELVGFMLSGTDIWQEQLTSYNAGTGVIPEFRGQRLVDQMYNWALPLWREAGYTQATLEVIVENARAIKAYERVGMRIDRKLISLQSPESTATPLVTNSSYFLQETDQPDWSLYASLRSFAPSWDFCRAGVQAVQDTCRFFELKDQETTTSVAYAIVNDKAQIAQAGVVEGWPQGWEILMSQLSVRYSQLKWINIDEQATYVLDRLRQQQWSGIIDQYEMKMKI